MGRRSSSSSSSPASPERSPARKEVGLRQVFDHLDANGDGKISAEEMRSGLALTGEEVAEEEVDAAVGEMCFEEFKRIMENGRESDLRRAFEVLEGGAGRGAITAGALRWALGRMGVERTEEECKRMIMVYDVDGNGTIDFEEFRRMMSL